MSLNCSNFLFSNVGLLVCYLFKMFKIKFVSLWKMMFLSTTFCGFIVFTNYSLKFNTVGTSQCIKSLNTPLVALFSTYYFKQSYTIKIKFTLVILFYIYHLIITIMNWADAKRCTQALSPKAFYNCFSYILTELWHLFVWIGWHSMNWRLLPGVGSMIRLIFLIKNDILRPSHFVPCLF